jgi:hypothetical protein
LEVSGERQVVLERGMDHTVGPGRGFPEDVEVVEGAALHLRPGVGDDGGRGVRAGQRHHLVARVDEPRNDGGADPAGRARDEYPHEVTSGH